MMGDGVSVAAHRSGMPFDPVIRRSARICNPAKARGALRNVARPRVPVFIYSFVIVTDAPGRSHRLRRRREDAFVGFLFRALLDLDRAFEVRSVFDHDLHRGQISIHRTVFLYLDPTVRVYVSLHFAVDYQLTDNGLCRHLCRRSDRQLSLVELDQSFDETVDY